MNNEEILSIIDELTEESYSGYQVIEILEYLNLPTDNIDEETIYDVDEIKYYLMDFINE